MAKAPPPYTSRFQNVRKERLLRLLDDKIYRPIVSLAVLMEKLRGQQLAHLNDLHPCVIDWTKQCVLGRGYSREEFAAALAVTLGAVARPE